MKINSLEEVKRIGAGYKIVPVYTEMLSDMTTPIEVLKRLKQKSRNCYVLESVEEQRHFGRYTFLGYDPIMEITCQNGELTVKERDTELAGGNGQMVQKEQKQIDHPGTYVREVMKNYTSPKIEGLPSFTGGLVGYFSYDYVKYSEPTLKLDAYDEHMFKDMDLMLFDKVIAFDNLRQKLILIVNIPMSRVDEEYKTAVQSLADMKELILRGEPVTETSGSLKSDFNPMFEKEKFCEMVEKAKRYIYEGDIFQVVLSNRMEAEYEGSLLDTYRYLRTSNPSPYMFYFSSDDLEVAGASPETLVKLENGVLHTFPLAGTRRRGYTKQEDEALEKELLADEKERAEHNMLVDLGRNDIGKISEFGSVEVEKYMEIERYSHVMHIGSTVRGTIRAGKDALDAVDAILPAGTLSGAPKLRALQIINELENVKRGIYGGAIGYIDFTGNLDTCIAIRIAFKKGNKVFVHSGAGIVADSVPELEFKECINKAKAVKEALGNDITD
ncbi:MAG: anthranilate synthase component I [Lachnospiraceae bacterium]|nr:anthranilate synthase component I [Lachnospiraceae bacterium]